MYVLATFEQTLYLEIALKEIEQMGIAKAQILAVPLTKKFNRRKTIETVLWDGVNPFDGTFIGATAFMVFGLIYGFLWKWGPVLWALIGMFVGAALGFIYDTLRARNKKTQEKSKSQTEVIVMIACSPEQAEKAMEVLWNHFAIGVAPLDLAKKQIGTAPQ